MHPDDIASLGREPRDSVDVIGCHDDGIERAARGFVLVAHDIPRGCVAGYYPELNCIVPHETFGEKSFTPTSKSVTVRFEPH